MKWLGVAAAMAATLLPGAASAKASMTPIWVTCDARLEHPVVTLRIADETFVDLENKTTLARLRAASRRYRLVTLKNAMDLPYTCIGAAILTLQRAGFEKIGFISEPPPP